LQSHVAILHVGFEIVKTVGHAESCNSGAALGKSKRKNAPDEKVAPCFRKTYIEPVFSL